MTRIEEIVARHKAAAGLSYDALPRFTYYEVNELLCAIERKDAALRAAQEITNWGRNCITQMAMFQASCERVHKTIWAALTPARETDAPV